MRPWPLCVKALCSAATMSARDFEAAARNRQAKLLKPPGSLGRLESLAIQIAGIQETDRPQCRPAAALIFASDHPVAQLGVSAYPPAVTATMVDAFAAGGAASTTMARKLGVDVQVIDVGVDGPGAALESVGTVGDLVTQPAMDAVAMEAAMTAGCDAIDRLAPEVRVVLLGEMGIGNTTPASCLMAKLLGLTAREVVGPGTGVFGDALERKRDIVGRALERAADVSAAEAMSAVGGRELAALAGAMKRAAGTGRVIVVDGFVVTASALWCCEVFPAARRAMIFSHRSAEPAHDSALKAMEADPLLDLSLRLGEGTGALASFPLLELACTLHNEMSTFADAGLVQP